jgi:adenylate cyclase
MPSRLSRLHYVLHELKRRHVIRVVGAYVFCVWVILQVGAIVFPPLLVPGWVLTVMVVLSIIGLPLVAVLTWMYDITPRGVVRTRPIPHHEPPSLHLNWHYVDLVIIAALLSVLSFLLLRPEGNSVPEPGRSIAVLPFTDLSANRDSQYFSDGLAEVLIDSLGRIGELRVMSRTSTFAFRDHGGDLEALAERFDVDTILEGSVRKSDNRVRVNTRLVDARHGHSLWSETYHATLDDIFEVQDNIARSVAEVLQVRLLGDEVVVEVATEIDEAYDHYLRGRAFLRREGTLDNVLAAMEHFGQALELDSRFALAWAGLCTAHWQRYESTRDSTDADEALEVCRQAEIHDDRRAETHIALGNTLAGTGQYQRALAAYYRALEIEPDRSEVQIGLGQVMEHLGHDEEAESHYRRAIELDPAYWRNYSFLSAFLAASGRLEEAIAEIEKGIRLEPDSPRLYSNLGAFYLITGDHERAAWAFGESIDREPTARAYSNAGAAWFYVGEFATAEGMFRGALAINPTDYRYHAHLADSIAIQGGRDAEAMQHYEYAVEYGRRRLEVNPNDHDCRAAVALSLLKTEQPDAAREEIHLLSEQDHLSRDAHWQLGQARYLLGDPDAALEHFSQAIELGLSPRHLVRNPGLKPLFNHPRFIALIGEEPDQD